MSAAPATSVNARQTVSAGHSRLVALVQGLFGLAAFFLLWWLLVDVYGVWRFRQLPKLTASVREWLSPNPTYGISLYTQEYYKHLFSSIKRWPSLLPRGQPQRPRRRAVGLEPVPAVVFRCWGRPADTNSPGSTSPAAGAGRGRR
jgi:hypothetical protein